MEERRFSAVIAAENTSLFSPGKKPQFPGDLEGSLNAINRPGGYSAGVNCIPMCCVSIVSTSPLRTPRIVSRSLSTATTRYSSSKIFRLAGFILKSDAETSPHDL